MSYNFSIRAYTEARKVEKSAVPQPHTAFPHRIGGIGAIIGDIVGSPYEFDHNNIKTEDFPLFSARSYFTDDTVLTLAVAEGLLQSRGQELETVRQGVIDSMQEWCLRYPDAGYGARFLRWMDDPQPYGSFGNGSAMRVSAVGWLFDSIDDVLKYAELTSAVSHDHPEGIKGAQAVASAIFLTRGGMSKEQLKKFITKHFGYDLSRTLADIRPNYRHVESCRRPSRPIWKASVLRMCSARLFHSAGTPTPSQLSLPALRKPATPCLRGFARRL